MNNCLLHSPKRIARRTLRGSSKKVCFGGSGVTILPDLRSLMPELDRISLIYYNRKLCRHRSGNVTQLTLKIENFHIPLPVKSSTELELIL